MRYYRCHLLMLFEIVDDDAEHHTDWKLELSRHDIAKRIGCSYSTANRLVQSALKDKSIKCRWTHQHQSYWEAWFSIA